MLDVTDNAWCWDGTSKYFGKFEDRVAERFLAKNGGRIALGWYFLAGDATLTADRITGFILQPPLEYEASRDRNR